MSRFIHGILPVFLAIFLPGPTRTAMAVQEIKSGAFIPVDTWLMGQPDSHAILGLEPAFASLTFVLPVDLTHAGDGSNRLFAE